MTIKLELEFERAGFRVYNRAVVVPEKDAPRYIWSGALPILHRLDEHILTANVFGTLEKLDYNIWLRAFLERIFGPENAKELVSTQNLQDPGVKFAFWKELPPPGPGDRPRGREEEPTRVDVLIETPEGNVSIQCRLRGELAKLIETDKPDLDKGRYGTPEASWWDEAIRNIERGYRYSFPKRFYLVFLSVEDEKPIFSQYRSPEKIKRKIESPYRWTYNQKKFFNDQTYEALSKRIAWVEWKTLLDVLDAIQFPDKAQNGFRVELVEYLESKTALLQKYFR